MKLTTKKAVQLMKLKGGIYWGAGCGGCDVAVLDIHEKILDDRPLDETHPLWPTSHYGAHKAAVARWPNRL